MGNLWETQRFKMGDLCIVFSYVDLISVGAKSVWLLLLNLVVLNLVPVV